MAIVSYLITTAIESYPGQTVGTHRIILGFTTQLTVPYER